MMIAPNAIATGQESDVHAENTSAAALSMPPKPVLYIHSGSLKTPSQASWASILDNFEAATLTDYLSFEPLGFITPGASAMLGCESRPLGNSFNSPSSSGHSVNVFKVA